MKKTIEKEVHICENCGNECYPHPCIRCGKEFCYECSEIKGIDYKAGVFYSGSGDGFYCHECNNLLRGKNDPLHTAYVTLQALRDEYNGWWKNFDERVKKAEEHLKELLQNK